MTVENPEQRPIKACNSVDGTAVMALRTSEPPDSPA